ncbi:hypothetical protein TRFO_28124 [Tritrichomonas foetus]|uniref:Signal peptidase complex subunit 3 n=1 Tax=Tritrichomonas foetus TaxID=1144522 RepID=A0A1J4K3P0_9EUKA|nr:hypothetical protein TRFO_28124 [Tritrichomonas foetus]|eukprot:OHT04364.1 hypothetical protein TRFO_28124 [Tritrichomonas foetus]
MLRMNSMFNRLYSLFYMGMTAVCTVAGIGALMAYLYSLDAKVDFDVAKIGWFHPSRRGYEEAQLYFDIDADLTPLIHVNTRLFYAYILAEWGNNTETDQHNVVLWDMLIKRENPHFDQKMVKCNYNLRQVGLSMRGKPVKLSFRIQLVPFVGFFKTKTLLTKEFVLPEKYSDSN